MLIAVHSVAGGIVGESLGNPVLAFLAGFVLHFILDMIPHEYKHDSKKMSALDWSLIIIDIIITVFVWRKYFSFGLDLRSSFFWGALGGILPDLMDNVPVLKIYFRTTRFGKKFHKFHEDIQKIIVGVIPGTIIQYGLLALMIWYWVK